MEIQLIRDAIVVMRLSRKILLVDLMLSLQKVLPQIPNSDNDHRNPLVSHYPTSTYLQSKRSSRPTLMTIASTKQRPRA